MIVGVGRLMPCFFKSQVVAWLGEVGGQMPPDIAKMVLGMPLRSMRNITGGSSKSSKKWRARPKIVIYTSPLL